MPENKFKKELEELINKHSKENDTNTPDFILANYVNDCLYVYETAVLARDKWYGIEPSPQLRTNNLFKKNIEKANEKARTQA